MIKGILFDYDGTLSNRIKSAYLKYTSDIQDLFPNLNSIEKEAIVQRCMTWDEYGTINKSHVYTQLKKAYDLDIDVDEYVKKWYKNFYKFQVLQEDCKEILTLLREKYKLGVITNGDSYSQNIKLKETGVYEYFDFTLVSGDYGIHKPDKRIFLMASEKMGLEPYEIAFIGDTFATDILGAYRANMKPVWFFNDPLRYSDIDVTRIHDFKELKTMFL